jgi:hypothetical protein
MIYFPERQKYWQYKEICGDGDKVVVLVILDYL